MELQWRIKRQESAGTFHASAMYQTGKSIAEGRVVTREAKTWKSRVNATMALVSSQFGNFCLAMPPTRPTELNAIYRLSRDAAPGSRRFHHEIVKTEFVAFALLLPLIKQRAGSVRSGGSIGRTIDGSDRTAAAGSGRTADAGTIAATGSADRIVSGCVGGADSRSSYLSRSSCGSGSVAATTYRTERRTTRPGSR